MPELPEVETTRCGVAPYAEGYRVEKVVVRDRRLRWPVPMELDTQLPGSTIGEIQRRGKYLLFATDTGTLIVHLGMSGSLRVLTEAQQPARHDHVDIVLSNNCLLRYNDPRRFGCMLWTLGDPSEHSLLSHLGPEPLLEDFTANYLHQRSRGRKASIKTFIMDSQVVVGVGNIYANEALYRAGISPLRAAGRISLQRYELLVAAIKSVLGSAIKQGGTTLRDFVGGDGQPGYFKQQLAVYDRGGQPCRSCGRELREVRLGQRSTVYCTVCQR
ncbi:bifunctional DNA-formamidopyrimidine glycosylase/DNA-(apurinic or apyrimidinic site) lyase [Halieaceae bacterium IMCC14734]|uniref:Formamidopyrimidine-DNA glycosylase n=1 Tax=Candidatus Litorirhabdus singularis TaxID=2518993 RepID=A0ABT3TF32_9GAMM|nr:bifunctional DNA-formamidopyrimidine glycosylase/DNA-(apurinic or apyrimidinic site) lyase [Candidatus Litorirhabdus singularis]MCX2980027.1 bifunctional DNA-formamidopyrimidine glycosylase/DNA-(apurinic or apyrimidinic site) lyase [Candidatus Litorirhabdus singularis]